MPDDRKQPTEPTTPPDATTVRDIQPEELTPEQEAKVKGGVGALKPPGLRTN